MRNKVSKFWIFILLMVSAFLSEKVVAMDEEPRGGSSTVRDISLMSSEAVAALQKQQESQNASWRETFASAKDTFDRAEEVLGAQDRLMAMMSEGVNVLKEQMELSERTAVAARRLEASTQRALEVQDRVGQGIDRCMAALAQTKELVRQIASDEAAVARLRAAVAAHPDREQILAHFRGDKE